MWLPTNGSPGLALNALKRCPELGGGGFRQPGGAIIPKYAFELSTGAEIRSDHSIIILADGTLGTLNTGRTFIHSTFRRPTV